MGGLIFGFVGALIRWILSGFKKKFTDIYKPETVYDDAADIASEEMKNIIIGALVPVLIIILVAKLIN